MKFWVGGVGVHTDTLDKLVAVVHDKKNKTYGDGMNVNQWSLNGHQTINIVKVICKA